MKLRRMPAAPPPPRRHGPASLAFAAAPLLPGLKLAHKLPTAATSGGGSTGGSSRRLAAAAAALLGPAVYNIVDDSSVEDKVREIQQLPGRRDTLPGINPYCSIAANRLTLSPPPHPPHYPAVVEWVSPDHYLYPQVLPPGSLAAEEDAAMARAALAASAAAAGGSLDSGGTLRGRRRLQQQAGNGSSSGIDGSGASIYPDDPEYPSQWHLPNIDAPHAWAITRGAGASNRLCIVDTGMQKDHPDLPQRELGCPTFAHMLVALSVSNAKQTRCMTGHC